MAKMKTMIINQVSKSGAAARKCHRQRRRYAAKAAMAQQTAVNNKTLASIGAVKKAGAPRMQ